MDLMHSFTTFRDAIKQRRTSAIRPTGAASFDGLAEWRAVKHSLSSDAGDTHWSPLVQSPERRAFYAKAMLLPEVDAHGRTIEPHHFLMQCARIPVLERPSPRKVMQIALNIGQLEAEVDALGLDSLLEDSRELYAQFKRLGMDQPDAYV